MADYKTIAESKNFIVLDQYTKQNQGNEYHPQLNNPQVLLAALCQALSSLIAKPVMVGMVAILSSMSPVLLLPLLWLRLGRTPAAGAWWGAGMTVLGTAVLLLR